MKEYCLTSRFKIYEEDELSPDDRRLVEMAKEAVKTAYVPYSRFHVGAAVMTADGHFLSASNQENAAYPSGLCAERTVLFYAGAHYPDSPVQTLAVAAFHKHAFTPWPIPPCGACRQVMLETEKRAGSPLRILLYGTKGIYLTEGVENLLPLSFTADNIK